MAGVQISNAKSMHMESFKHWSNTETKVGHILYCCISSAM